MDLRALLFTADGSCSATLCQILTDLGIEAEICSEIMVAAQRLTAEKYDAIIVDWDLEEAATQLLKTARQQKALSLNLALVPDEGAIARAWQQGANSVIRKPIDRAQAHETLSTARDLILSRRTDQRQKESRNLAEALPVEAPAPEEEPIAPKAGFLTQSMTRSAFEAEEKVSNADTSGELRWQAARGPASLEGQESEAKEIQPVSKQRWDEVKSIFREKPAAESDSSPEAAQESTRSQDATGVFSSLPEEHEAPGELESSAPPRYLVFAMTACVVVAGALYVWAPGGSYLGRVSSAFHILSAKTRAMVARANAPKATAPVAASEAAPSAPIKPSEEMLPDPGPVVSTDVDPSKIQIIETKVIPKPGAQQPVITEPPPDSDQAKALAEAQSQSQTPPASENSSPPVAGTEAPSPQPIPQAPPAPVRPPPRPQNSLPPSEQRVGVIIPDSLRTTPAPATASSVETFMVSEPTAMSWLVHRVDPQYPAQALPQRLEGTVVLQAWIAKDGTVQDLKLVKGYFLLGRAAIDAVKQWTFRPYVQNGKAMDFQTSISVAFKYPN